MDIHVGENVYVQFIMYHLIVSIFLLIERQLFMISAWP